MRSTSKPPPSRRPRRRPSSPSAKGSGASRLGRGREPGVDEDPTRDRDPRVARAGAPDGEREPPARPQDAASLADGCLGIGHEHEAEPAEDAVDRVVLERDLLCVDHAVLDVPEPELGRPAARDLDHLGREVARDQPAFVAQARRSDEARVSRPRRQLEHGVTRLRVERLHHPLRDRAREPLEPLAHTLPAGRHRLPVLERRAPVLGSIHGGDRRRSGPAAKKALTGVRRRRLGSRSEVGGGRFPVIRVDAGQDRTEWRGRHRARAAWRRVQPLRMRRPNSGRCSVC